MGALFARLFAKKDEKRPIKSFRARIENVMKIHYRGLIGVAVPLFLLPWQGDRHDPAITVCCMWFWMFWFFLLRPINIPCTGLIPVFLLPMAGVMKTDETAACYMGEGIGLFILASMLILLLNNSGFDRRLAYWIICAGGTGQFSGKRLVFKFSSAAFWLSIFSSRLITCSLLTQLITPCLMKLQDAQRPDEPSYKEMRYIINSAIQSSCSIGGLAIVHSSFTIMSFRAIYSMTSPEYTFPDVFNYLEYTSFAFPVALVMFLANCLYHVLLLGWKCKKGMSAASMSLVHTTFRDLQKEIPRRITLHEKLSVFFAVFYLCMFFTRWNKYMSGWSSYQTNEKMPGIRDATVAAIFVILLHALPKGYRFTRYLTAKKKSELGPIKAESAILWWRFVDKHVVYGYMFLIGSGVALSRAINVSGADKYIAKQEWLNFIDKYNWPVAALIIIICSALCANFMSGTAACCIIMPLIMNLPKPLGKLEGAAPAPVAAAPAPAELRRYGWFWPSAARSDDKTILNDWVQKVTCLALATGMSTSFGFMLPFIYTPAYFCHYIGKVPKLKQFVYGIGSAVICAVILWVAITFYAPVLWKPENLQLQDWPIQKIVKEASVTEAATMTITTVAPAM